LLYIGRLWTEKSPLHLRPLAVKKRHPSEQHLQQNQYL
jgi:hypothetical protein